MRILRKAWHKSVMVFALAMSSAHSAPVIFDNDMAIDDWAALLYLLHHPAADVRAVTIAASGESRCAPALKNTLALLDLPGNIQAVPVACGDPFPLDGYFVFPEAWRTDSDTLSGVELPPSRRKASDRHAVEVIHQAIKEASEPVILVATGPLTNIAQWLEQYPQDRQSVAQLVIMGGSWEVPGNIIVPGFTDEHPNTSAEWNIFIDPLAADKVLAADMPTLLVGLDVTNSVRVTEEVAKRFKASASTASADFWSRVLTRNDWFIASGEYYFWDTLAALIAVDPGLCQGEQMSLGVVYKSAEKAWEPTTDRSMPSERWDGAPRSHLDAKTSGTLTERPSHAPIKVCLKTKPESVFSEFQKQLNDSP